jgi:membrane protease YdiL (CAAX protease family)
MSERIYGWAKPVLAVGFLSAGIVHCPCGGVGALVLGGLAGTALFVLLARTMPVIRPSPLASRATWGMLLRAAADEVLWRGWLPSLPIRPGLPYAVVATSIVIFALTHFPKQGSRGAATHLVTGSVFVALMLSSGLVGAVVAHSLYNMLVLTARATRGGEGAAGATGCGRGRLP